MNEVCGMNVCVCCLCVLYVRAHGCIHINVCTLLLCLFTQDLLMIPSITIYVEIFEAEKFCIFRRRPFKFKTFL